MEASLSTRLSDNRTGQVIEAATDTLDSGPGIRSTGDGQIHRAIVPADQATQHSLTEWRSNQTPGINLGETPFRIRYEII